MSKPLINWDALQDLVMPRPPQNAGQRQGERPKGPPQGGIGGWDHHAPFYNMMTELEAPYTLKQLGDNIWYNRIYDMGYDVNLRVLEDGYTRTYKTRGDAYADLAKLYNRNGNQTLPETGIARFHENVDKYSTQNADGTITFLVKTGSIVLWWKPEKHQ